MHDRNHSGALLPGCRSMFVHDRQFFTVDPARSLYNVMSSYASIMLANSLLTVINAGIFMLLMYALIGAAPLSSSTTHPLSCMNAYAQCSYLAASAIHAWSLCSLPLCTMHAHHPCNNCQPSTCSHNSTLSPS